MAVQWIGSLSDAELLDYLPQLVQVGGLAFPPVLMVPPQAPGQSAVCPWNPGSQGLVVVVGYRQWVKPPVGSIPNRP